MFLFYGCKSKTYSTCHITARIFHAIHQTAIIETLPRPGEPAVILDSIRISSNDQTITFTIPLQEDIPCRFYLRGTNISGPCILHPDSIKIAASLFQPQNGIVVNSRVNTPLYSFLQSQEKIITEANQLMGNLDKQANPSIKKAGWQTYDSILNQVQERYRNYADTVSSSGAFLYVYTFVDFGTQYTEVKNFINKASTRFPISDKVRKLRDRTLDFVKTFEIEFQIGDTLPPILLSDATGNATLVKPARTITLINFWSTWCGSCIEFIKEEKHLQQSILSKKVRVINIALDPEKDTWKSFLFSNKPPGMQFIDEKVWEGNVIHHWRIDSIPFNWLLDAQGKIIRKAIPKDSLLQVIEAATR